MFASTGSASQSNSGISGCPPFGLGNQKGDAFASKTKFDFPPGMPSYGGISTWGSSQTSSSLFPTTFGAPLFSGFGSSMAALGSSSSTPLEGHSSCCKFGCSPVFTQCNKKGDSFASNSHGTSNWAFGQTSSPFATPTTFGVPLIYGLESSSSGGSRIAGYRRTAESRSVEELISISAMPAYKAKSHEELRWEDYKITGRGGFGICSSGDSKPVANFSSSGSWGTTSNSTTLVKPNPFGNTFPSVATEPTSLKYPCPTCTPTWKYPGITSTTFTSSLANTPFSLSSAPSNSFNGFVPTTTLPSTATHTSSSSFFSPTFPAFTSSLASMPSLVNAFWSTPTAGPFTSSVSTVSTQLTSNLNQPTTLFNPFVPSTLNSNGTPTTTSITTTTRAVLDEINKQQPISDYYTIPPISEVEAKEKAEPGFGSRIKDFVIGCFGYGSNLDPETHVQFNHCEVIVYMDETNKPPVGEGLNKPAEITLLNIRFIDKKTGVQYREGSKVDRYTEMLKKVAVAQGAEFMSYDPIEGEWKFRVECF